MQSRFINGAMLRARHFELLLCEHSAMPPTPLRLVQFAASGAIAVTGCSLGACIGETAYPRHLGSSEIAPAPDSRAAEASAHLRDEILAEIGDAACDSDTQCHSVAVGAKPCGGPEVYLSWSDKRSNAGRLLALVDRHRDARRAENTRRGLLSDCRVVRDPGATCRTVGQDGRMACQPGGDSQGGAARSN